MLYDHHNIYKTLYIDITNENNNEIKEKERRVDPLLLCTYDKFKNLLSISFILLLVSFLKFIQEFLKIY